MAARKKADDTPAKGPVAPKPADRIRLTVTIGSTEVQATRDELQQLVDELAELNIRAGLTATQKVELEIQRQDAFAASQRVIAPTGPPPTPMCARCGQAHAPGQCMIPAANPNPQIR